MDEHPTPLHPDEAERRFAEMLEEAELPCFSSTFYDPEIDHLQFTWERGFTIFMDLSDGVIDPLDDWDRASILGLPLPCCDEHEPFHLFVAGSGEDPRTAHSVPGVEIHHVPALHPDDLTTLHGFPVASPSRTLIDCAEVVTADELREMFACARELGLLDPAELRAARARVEWRPSLETLDEVIDEFCG